MYLPAHFAETDPTKLFDFIERHNFGLLTSSVEGVPFVSHLPFLVERQSGPRGTLVGHMARANPQWRELETQTALVVFAGPHAYISPTWYEARNVVPTWNYTAVHVVGRVRLVHDPHELLQIVRDAVAVQESSMPRPWAIEGDEAFVDRLLSQIVGFRIEIERMEGKFKLSQNHAVERREKVVRALEAENREDSRATARMMRATLPEGE